MHSPSSSPKSSRDQARTSMFLAAILQAEGGSAAVRVRNLSPSGAMVESPLIPQAGAPVELRRGSLFARGTVVWIDQSRCGLRFDSLVGVREWLAAPASNPEQQRVDEMIALVRGQPTSRSGLGKAIDTRSRLNLAEDLAAASALLEDLETDLTSSNETLERHALKLQNVDIALQMIRAVARELGGVKFPGSVAILQDSRRGDSGALQAS